MQLMRVNLTDGGVRKDPIPLQWPRRLLGGYGYATALLVREVPPTADPLGPDNRLYFGPGALLGTGIPTASKTLVVGKAPLTGTAGRASVGARAGVELKKAGYALLAIEGCAAKPMLLHISDGTVELLPAEDLWGLDTRETAKRLKATYPGHATFTIGPAGERLSCIAHIDADGRQAGRGGLGAVMGSKRLKAIAIKGTGEIPVADKERMRQLNVEWGKFFKAHPSAQEDMKYGTGEFYAWMNLQKGTFPTRNWQQGYFQKAFDGLKEGELSGIDPYSWAPRYAPKPIGCPYCNKPCGHEFEVKEGPNKGVALDGLEYETMYSLGGNLDIDDPEIVGKLHMECDLLGLDAISAGCVVGFAMEAAERKLLSHLPAGLDLRFGNGEAASRLLRMMAYREGELGKLLADGVKRAQAQLGPAADAFAMHVKGLELPAYDVRGIKGMALAFAVSNRGGCHLTAGVYGTELTGKWWRFEGVDRFSAKDKGFEVKLHEDLMALYDAVGVCKFSRHMFYLEKYPEILKAATGEEFSNADLLAVGERIYNLQRLFNVRAGLTRKDDYLPKRVHDEPIPKGVSAGHRVTREELDEMLDNYYAARGWTSGGVPTKAKLAALDLDELAAA